MNPPIDHPRRCKAHSSRTGERCKKWAVKGAMVCKAHGASAAHVRDAADKREEQEQARKAVATFGLPVDVEPHDALLQEVHRAAGAVAWLQTIVADLNQPDVVRGITKQVTLPDGSRRVEVAAAVSQWVLLWQQERDRLRIVAAEAIRAGVEERQVRVQEQQAQQLAQVVSAIVTELGHDPTDVRVRTAIRRGFALVQGGAA